MPAKLRKLINIGLYLLVVCVSTGISNPTPLNDYGMVTSGKMKFYLTRTHKSKTATLGAISLIRGGTPLFWTLEPPDRKWKPRTIPAGTYVGEVLPPLKNGLPRMHLLSVEGFSGVYLEVGNFPKNTRGCVLVGLSAEGEELRESRKAYRELLDSLGSSLSFILVISDVRPTSKL